MLRDLEREGGTPGLACDICVVGGGAVGLVAAVHLARAGRRVVLLEGGGVGLETRSQALQRGSSTGHPFTNIETGRYRVLGGSTTFWGGQVLPFDPIVFEPRPWLGGATWPFDRNELDPYYQRAYDAVGLQRAEPSDEGVWQKVGVDPDLGPELETILTRWVPVRNFSSLYKKDIYQSDRLQVVVHANVTGFVTDGGARITGVEARSVCGRQMTVSASAVVLACGTIEIARLLLQPPRCGNGYPWTSNRWIGRGFTDHLNCRAGQVEILDRDGFRRLFDSIYLDGHKYYPRLRLPSDAQAAREAIDVAAEFTFETRYTEHLENIKMFLRSLFEGQAPDRLRALPGHVLAVSRIAVPLALRYLVAHRSYKPTDAKVQLAFTAEQIPHAESMVRLGGDTDALGMARVEVDWRIDGRELASLADFARRIRDVLGKRGLAHVVLDPDLEREDPAFLAKVDDSIHQMSTARIGRTADDGVVDETLRVHGTDNLYVAGAAVFPVTGFANPTFTAIALALRLCDHLGRATADG